MLVLIHKMCKNQNKTQATIFLLKLANIYWDCTLLTYANIQFNTVFQSNEHFSPN